MPVSNAGNHVGEVVAVGLKKAGTGNVQVVIQFKDEEENTITAYLATSEAAWPYTEAKLSACGWVPKENDYDLTKLNDPECSMIGMRDIPFQVNAETYEGKTNMKVSWIGAGGGITERMPEDETKKFAADLRAKLIAKNGQPTPAAKKAAPWKK